MNDKVFLFLFAALSCQPRDTYENYIPEFSEMEHTRELLSEKTKQIAEKIYENETGGTDEKMVFWNENESFPSLGIGHAIWVQRDNPEYEKYGSSFPSVLRAIQAAGFKLPSFIEKLAPHYDCPWPTYSAYLQDSTILKEREELLALLKETKHIQLQTITSRYQKAEKRFRKEGPPEIITFIQALKASPVGEYPLLDYVNFKGEGSDDPLSWGLKNVLKAASQKTGPAPERMTQACIEVLVEGRISRDPKVAFAREAWTKRCQTYSSFRFK